MCVSADYMHAWEKAEDGSEEGNLGVSEMWFRFDVSYARGFACGGCSSVVSSGCVKCPRCEHVFPIR